MSRGGETTLNCWDGEHSFRLGLGELRQLQERCDAGPLAVANRLRDGTWLVDDIREALRLGLIGAGVKQIDALKLIETHVDAIPLLQNVATAHAVVMAAILGPEDESVGKDQAEASPNLKETSSPSPNSTAPAL